MKGWELYDEARLERHGFRIAAARARAHDDDSGHALLDLIRPLVQHGGWMPLYSVKDGPPLEVQALLVRGQELLCVVLLEPQQRPTPQQTAWLAQLAATGKVETYAWTRHESAAMRARLSRPAIRKDTDVSQERPVHVAAS